MMKQRNFAAAACVALLAGCSGSNVLLGLGVAGRHLGVGTGLSIPVGSRNNGSNVQDFGNLRIIEEQVVTYFARACMISAPIRKAGCLPLMPSTAIFCISRILETVRWCRLRIKTGNIGEPGCLNGGLVCYNLPDFLAASAAGNQIV